jgi:hypothetical protein
MPVHRSTESPAIGILRWEEGGSPRGLEQLEELPGNSVNPASYDFPVDLRRVQGANIQTILESPSQDALRAMIREARRMERRGVRAITTSCGFNAIFQNELADAVDIPVFTSSLMQVPLVQTMMGEEQMVGIITAKKSALTPHHLRNVGIDDRVPVHIEGLDACSEWNKIFSSPDTDIVTRKVGEDLVEMACALTARLKIGALIFECTDLPPFSDAVRKATGRPVFDFITLTNLVYQAVGTSCRSAEENPPRAGDNCRSG